MNDVAAGLVFGCAPAKIAARRLYRRGTAFESATPAMRKRASQRRKAFVRATGQKPVLIEVIRWYARREGVGLVYRLGSEKAVAIAPDGTEIEWGAELTELEALGV
jgi:hypothetical protein